MCGRIRVVGAILIVMMVCGVQAVFSFAAASSDTSPDRLQRDTDALHATGVTGASAYVRTAAGVRTARSGVADIKTGEPMPQEPTLRTASNTKAYVATVVLQLAGEGRLSLNDTVEKWLPGIVAGHGNDGSAITLRNLLGHTSGLHNYTDEISPQTAEDYEKRRHLRYTAAELVAGAMRHQPDFRPGEKWSYSNTNYILAGMVIEAATGHTWQHEVITRIVRPLGLRHTWVPSRHPVFPAPHATEYEQFVPNGPLVDVTAPYLPWELNADNGVVSTSRDLDRFFTALSTGRLLAPAQLAEMRDTIPMPPAPGVPPGSRAGLGTFWTPLSCGGGYWGHSGSTLGTITWPAVTDDGSAAVNVSLHSRSRDQTTAVRQFEAIQKLVDHALCDARNNSAQQSRSVIVAAEPGGRDGA